MGDTLVAFVIVILLVWCYYYCMPAAEGLTNSNMIDIYLAKNIFENGEWKRKDGYVTELPGVNGQKISVCSRFNSYWWQCTEYMLSSYKYYFPLSDWVYVATGPYTVLMFNYNPNDANMSKGIKMTYNTSNMGVVGSTKGWLDLAKRAVQYWYDQLPQSVYAEGLQPSPQIEQEPAATNFITINSVTLQTKEQVPQPALLSDIAKVHSKQSVVQLFREGDEKGWLYTTDYTIQPIAPSAVKLLSGVPGSAMIITSYSVNGKQFTNTTPVKIENGELTHGNTTLDYTNWSKTVFKPTLKARNKPKLDKRRGWFTKQKSIVL